MKFALIVDVNGEPLWSTQYLYRYGLDYSAVSQMQEVLCPACMQPVHRAGSWKPKRTLLHDVIARMLAGDSAKAEALAKRGDIGLQVFLRAMTQRGEVLHYSSPEFDIGVLQDLSQVEIDYPFWAHRERTGQCPLENWNESGERSDQQRPESLDKNWHPVLQAKAKHLKYECEAPIGPKYKVDIRNGAAVLELEHTHEMTDAERFNYLRKCGFKMTLLQSPAKTLANTLRLTNPWDREDAARLARMKVAQRNEALQQHIEDSSPNPRRAVLGLLGSAKSNIALKPLDPSHVDVCAAHIPEFRCFGHLARSPLGLVMKNFRGPWERLAREVATSDLLLA
jgi:hypothetical protein